VVRAGGVAAVRLLLFVERTGIGTRVAVEVETILEAVAIFIASERTVLGYDRAAARVEVAVRVQAITVAFAFQCTQPVVAESGATVGVAGALE